jgi:di/tricarboxylate transporter
MSLETKRKVSLGLLALSILAWLLRKLNVLYIPGLSAIALGIAMIIVSLYMFEVKKNQKIWGILILAFGLFMLVAAGIEIYALATGQ